MPRNEEKMSQSRDANVVSLIDQLQTLKGHLNTRFDMLAKEKGMSSEQLYKYLSDPIHFTPVEWQKAETLREEMWEKVNTNLGRVDKKPRKTAHEIIQDTKNRKVKTLGARKNWLPVR